MILSPWLVVLLAVPVLLLGEWLVRRIPALQRFNIPAPVVGGLLVCLGVLLYNVSGLGTFSFGSRVNSAGWTWLVTAEPQWAKRPALAVNTPFMVGFFVCVGLNATWALVKKGGVLLVVFWVIASIFALLQNGLGMGLSVAMGQSPLLGIICGSVTLTGGHSTAQAFAPEIAAAGLAGASVIGVAAATFGLVAGALLGGPIATRLIEKNRLRSPEGLRTAEVDLAYVAEEPTFFALLRALARQGGRIVLPILIVLACIKGGAWVGYLLQQAGMIFPVSMGGMLVGLIIRNGLDGLGAKWLDNEIIDHIGTVLLSLFLAITMAGLNLVELAAAAVPMLVILVAQIVLMGLFAYYVTFRSMGRDYDAAVMAAGHCGFGLGATSNAMATMLAVVQRHGPARKAFLIVPPTGAMLVDITNAFSITALLNMLK